MSEHRQISAETNAEKENLRRCRRSRQTNRPLCDLTTLWSAAHCARYCRYFATAAAAAAFCRIAAATTASSHHPPAATSASAAAPTNPSVYPAAAATTHATVTIDSTASANNRDPATPSSFTPTAAANAAASATNIRITHSDRQRCPTAATTGCSSRQQP